MRRVKFDIPVFIGPDEMSQGTYWFDIQESMSITPIAADKGSSSYTGFRVFNPFTREKNKDVLVRFLKIGLARYDVPFQPRKWYDFGVESEYELNNEEYKKLLDKITEFNSSKFNTNDSLPSINLTEFAKSIKDGLHLQITLEGKE